jgi:putative transposase
VLSEHGCRIAPSTYYDARDRPPSRRARRDREVIALIEAERDTKFGRLLGARKMWLRLRGQGHEVARCTIERLFRELGITGVTRAKGPRTTVPAAGAEGAERPTDLVDRQFVANKPNQLWVADFTYVPTWDGMVYVAFIIDVFSRRVIGWRTASSMTTPLVLDALEMALWVRRKDGVADLSGLVHHTDAGSQYTSIAFTQRLLEAGVDASVGTVGDAYDNALAESHMGLFKSELIWPSGPWTDREHVEIETLDWVHWFNTERPHESIDDLTPIQAEQIHYTHRTRLTETG